MASGPYTICKFGKGFKPMRILITGGAGYIGSALVPRLLAEGHLVTVVDNFMYNQSTLLQHCMSSNFEVIRGDVSNSEFLDRLIYENEFELIIPLACLTGAPLCSYNPDYAYSVILKSITWLVNQEANKNVKIIYPTTNSGYGIGSAEMCTEVSPLNPISLYGKLKCDAEKVILSKGNSVSLRLATAFGVSPRMRLDLLVNDFVYKAVNERALVLFEGNFRRNFIHVQDICSAIQHTIRNWESMKDNIYNVGLSSANLTKRQLAEKIKFYLPKTEIFESSTGEDPDKRDYVVSNAKLEKAGWSPGYDLDDGIQELIKAYQIIKRNQHANI